MANNFFLNPFYYPQFQQPPVVTSQQLQQQLQQDTNNQDDQKQKEVKKRDRWTSIQTQVLVDEFVENYERTISSKAYEAWSKIKDEVNGKGAEKSIQQCKAKIKTLKDTYKRVKDNNKSTGAAPKTCMFFEHFDRIFSERPSIQLKEVKEVGASTEKEELRESSDSGKLEFSLDETVEEEFEQEQKTAFEANDKNGKRKQKRKNSFQEELLQLQGDQHRMFEESEKRSMEFMEKLFKEQRNDEKEEKEKDRIFFLKLAETFK